MDLLNTKIKCKRVWCKLDNHGFREGSIYDVINGKVILPDGSESNGTYDSVEKINDCFYAIFEEVTE